MKYSEKHLEEVKTEEINELILKMIDQRGREASILLSFVRIEKGNIDFIEKIIQNYSEKVDLQFIDFSIISTFFEVLKEQKNKIRQQEIENKELKKINEQMSIENKSLKADLILQTNASDMTIKTQKKHISELTTALKAKEEEISSFKSQIYALNLRIDCSRMSKEGPGILGHLKDKQKTPFNRLFIASQSSNDIYTLLLPHTDDKFGTDNSGNFFIEFELEFSVTISGVKIFSSDSNFPKSFDISVEGETVIIIKEARELNGKYKDMTVSFVPIRGRKVRFTQTGPNWDKGNNFLFIKGIELLSTELKYSRGVFATLVGESENEDPHKCPVIISAPYFDLNRFHSINAEGNISTFYDENSWFQVELTQGTAVLNGFRLKRCDGRLRSYKLICTDDSSKPESSWKTLIEIKEKTENEHDLLDIYEFAHPSPPTRFVRLVITGQNRSDRLHLQFYHFDLFGYYF